MSFILGITGGIATGKSSVVNYIKGLEIPIVDADLIAREIVLPNRPALKVLVDCFGKQIIDEKGHLDRKKLGDIVFNDATKRQQLDELLAPYLQAEIKRQIEQYQAEHSLVVVDIPLMYEKGYDEWMDQVAVVYCTPDQQVNRLMTRNHLTSEQAIRRIHSQLPIDIKKQMAEIVFDNSQTLEQTIKQVEQWLTDRKFIRKSR
ncbi:dephospho-CoA kinase [Enterococcus columbae]|uniref:Dephospho-CoA kinase n=1 Tax=Enterococcus columbae DSM 7374 = ATCC 51263 TaxID=1121865 RepID=S0KYR4_9ENTE|nr:dephospho-CoA kinase [Enterococcus columbae]EOT44396.1 dephospho-CoA kinase [Enterococcus columbae DSM 7374 = ATCC 51263]EOW84554.1 dephospho-CoA kinase [Enterococcus columbae DSM 7374 = ATCC 51263]